MSRSVEVNGYKVALEADLWYNRSRNIDVQRYCKYPGLDERKVTSLMEEIISLWSKKCTTCGKIKDIEDFPPAATSDGTSNKCNQCKNTQYKARIPVTDTKKCCDCKEFKPLGKFSKETHTKSGLAGRCKDCAKKRYSDKYVPRHKKAIRYTPDFKTCTCCDEMKPREDFGKNKHTLDSLNSWCNACHAGYQRDKGERNPLTLDEIRRNGLKYNYNLTLEEYQAKLDTQGGVCAICKQPETLYSHQFSKFRRLAIDHDHVTGQIRDLLCFRCNQAMGCMKDDPELIKSLLSYAEKWKER